MVASVTFASHRDAPLFPRHDSCFVCPHVHPSFRHLSRVKETMKECSVDCCAESVFHGVKFTQHRPRLVKRIQHSICANNTAWKLAFWRVLLCRRPCKQFVPTGQNPAQIKISRRVVLVLRLCAVASISSTFTSYREHVAKGWRSSADYCLVRCARNTKP